MPGAVVTRVITGYKTGQKNGIKEREDWTMNRDIFMELMVKREYKAVRSILDVMNTVDIASLLEELDDREMATAFRLIPKEKAADVFSNMNNAMQSHLVQMFTDQETPASAKTSPSTISPVKCFSPTTSLPIPTVLCRRSVWNLRQRPNPAKC